MRWKNTGDVEINIGVLGDSNDVLWEFRDFLAGLGTESNYKISMMLAKNQETIFRVMSFIPGGFDIMIIADCLHSSVYLKFAEKAWGHSPDLRIFLENSDTELTEGLYPHIMLFPNRDRLRVLIKKEIDILIAENKRKEEKENEKEGTD